MWINWVLRLEERSKRRLRSWRDSAWQRYIYPKHPALQEQHSPKLRTFLVPSTAAGIDRVPSWRKTLDVCVEGERDDSVFPLHGWEFNGSLRWCDLLLCLQCFSLRLLCQWYVRYQLSIVNLLKVVNFVKQRRFRFITKLYGGDILHKLTIGRETWFSSEKWK